MQVGRELVHQPADGKGNGTNETLNRNLIFIMMSHSLGSTGFNNPKLKFVCRWPMGNCRLAIALPIGSWHLPIGTCQFALANWRVFVYIRSNGLFERRHCGYIFVEHWSCVPLGEYVGTFRRCFWFPFVVWVWNANAVGIGHARCALGCF